MEITAKFYSPDDIMEFVRYFGGNNPQPVKDSVKTPPLKKQAVKESIPASEAEKINEAPAVDLVPAVPAAGDPEFTLEEVRKKLATLSKEGKKDQVQQLLVSFGVSKLTELSPGDYPAVMEKAGKL